MRIKVGKYTLCSDPYSLWIEEEHIVKKGKNKGEVTNTRVAGYSPTFETLISSFTANKVMDSDAGNLKELLSLLKTIMDDVETINRAAFEKDFKKGNKKRKEC